MKERDPIKNAMGIWYRTKIIGLVFGVIASVAVFFVLILMLIIAMYPIVKGGRLIAGVHGFWERITNTFTMKCFFCTNTDLNVKKEKKFYEKVDEINQDYLNGVDMPLEITVNGEKVGDYSHWRSMVPIEDQNPSIQLDIPLLLSASFYTHDAENIMFEPELQALMQEAISGDIFGKVSFYADEGDQYRIDWQWNCSECKIVGYYYSGDETPLFASKLRKHGKHQVRRDRDGKCIPIAVVKNCIIWARVEWYVYRLDIAQDDTLYTLEYDQQPYKSYRTPDEIWQNGKRILPPTFITWLIAKFFPDEFETRLPKEVKDLSHAHLVYLTSRKTMKNVIYSYKKGYHYLVGELYGSDNPSYPGPGNRPSNPGNPSNPGGVVSGTDCTYEIKDNNKKTANASNIKVKLLQCGENGQRGQPVPGEELIDLEKYILGVTYAEIGSESPYEAQKAEAIAARSYALTRGEKMGTSYLRMYQENGQWILPIRNCTEDQVYCDPDKGCSNTTDPSDKHNSTTVYSGVDTKAYKYKGPLPADAPIRKAVAETAGITLNSPNGKIYYSDYTDTQHKQWIKGANAGKDAYQLLVGTYGSDKALKENCKEPTIATGDWSGWKQADKTWASTPLGSGGSTLGKAGCAVTSIAKLISMSGTKVTIDNFNPGTMVKYLNAHGGFSGSAINWGSISSSGLAPNFKHGGTVSLSGSEQQKASKVKEYLDQGYYIVLKVRDADTVGSSSDHWVAVTGVSGDNILISDPSSNSTTAWPHYNSKGTIKFNYYKKTD